MVVKHYILILCNSPLEIPPTSPRGVFIWFALDGAFDVLVSTFVLFFWLRWFKSLIHFIVVITFMLFSFSSVIKSVPAHYV